MHHQASGRFLRGFLAFTVGGAALLRAQTAPPATFAGPVPPMVKLHETIPGAQGTRHTLFSIYPGQTGGSPLWQEGQEITFDASGSFTVFLGASTPAGMPQGLFSPVEARWLGVQLDGQAEENRILLVSVPYAFKAGDAETLGGHPLSDLLLAGSGAPVAQDGLHYLNGAAPGAVSGAGSPVTAATATGSLVPALRVGADVLTSAGTVNYLAKFTDAQGDIGNSVLFDNGKVGIGTTTPAQALDVAGSVNLSGNLLLPATTAAAGTPSAGVLFQGGSPILHSFAGAAGNNIFLGPSAGNFTMGGTGQQGSYNATLGSLTLYHNTTGSFNLGMGYASLFANTTGSSNTAIGEAALTGNTTGEYNVAIGRNGIGKNSSGIGNTGVGTSSLQNLTTGNFNIALGMNAGINQTTGSYNLDLDHAGVAGESGVIRIGTPGAQTQAFLAGITGVTPAGASPQMVVIDGNGQLGSQPIASATLLSTSLGATGFQGSNTGSANTAVGYGALNSNNSGANNTALGASTLYSNTQGSSNTALGVAALGFATGSGNIGIGYEAGLNVQSGSNNIDIGTLGANESATIRIGAPGTQTQAFVAGVTGVTPAGASPQPVVVDGNGQLGTQSAISQIAQGGTQTGTVRAVGVTFIIALYGIFPPRDGGAAEYPDQILGEIRMFAGNFAPNGFAFCNGQLLPINQYTALFSILGIQYGGDGITTFALPDLRAAVPMHANQ